MAEKRDLLQEIQEKQGTPYLSDLHICTFTEQTKLMIHQMPENRYSLREWNVAAAYIINEVVDLPSIDAVKDAIIKRTPIR